MHTQVRQLKSRPSVARPEIRPIVCDNLRRWYEMPPEVKGRFVNDANVVKLLDSLPLRIADRLLWGFLRGTVGELIPGWPEVVAYFNANSKVISELTANPGTYSMLERMYTNVGVEGAIDTYFLRCPGGIALRNRLDATIRYSREHLRGRPGEQLVLNLGSGSARDSISLSAQDKELAARMRVDCIDLDLMANQRGTRIATEMSVGNHVFILGDILEQRSRYHRSADFGILVGILCPTPTDRCVQILNIIRRYFKPGSQVVAATLLEEMLTQDLFCAYILREITGWQLRFRRPGELEAMFEAAGYKWQGVFADTPTNFYDIGIGIA